MAKYLDENGLLYFWQKVKTLVNGKENAFTKNTAFNKDFETSASNIKMNGTASAGSSDKVAKADHVHPSDTSKLGTSGNGSNVTVAFTAASTRANIATGEKLSVAFGKLAKWFADLKTVAFTGAYSDLTGKPTNVSAFTNDAEYVDFTQMKDYVPTVLPEYGFQTASDVRTIVTGYGYQTSAQVQSAINSAVSTVYKYKGSVAAVSNLPTSGNTTGDVWNVTATGMNYVWTGTAWDALGSELKVEAITNSEIDTIVAS